MTIDPALAKNLASRKRKDKIFQVVCQLAAIAGVILLVIFLSKIFVDGIGKLSWKFITDDLSNRAKRTGLWPAIVGSAYVMVLTTCISVPIGVGAAIYLEEFNKKKTGLTNLIQLNIELKSDTILNW